MQETESDYYFWADRRDLEKVGGDLALWFWYAKLKDYAKRFKKDKNGYVRVPPDVFAEDLLFNKKKVQRYNKKLEDKGLIKTDKVRRGGRTWAGYKLVR